MPQLDDISRYSAASDLSGCVHGDQEAAELAMVGGTFPGTTTGSAPQNQLQELSSGKRFSWLPGNTLATDCNEITTSFCTSVK